MPLRGMPEMTVLDLIAVVWLVFLVAGMSWYVDTGPRSAQSASALMRAKRMVWMEEMAQREVRIIDGNLLPDLPRRPIGHDGSGRPAGRSCRFHAFRAPIRARCLSG